MALLRSISGQLHIKRKNNPKTGKVARRQKSKIKKYLFVKKVDSRGFYLVYKGTVRRGDDNR